MLEGEKPKPKPKIGNNNICQKAGITMLSTDEAPARNLYASTQLFLQLFEMKNLKDHFQSQKRGKIYINL